MAHSALTELDRTNTAVVAGTRFQIVDAEDGLHVLELTHEGDKVSSDPARRGHILRMSRYLIETPAIIGPFVKTMRAKERPSARSSGHLKTVAAGGKVVVRAVTFKKSEGATGEVESFMKHGYYNWSDANQALREMAFFVFPSKDEGVEVSFRVVWTDDESYEGTIHVYHVMTSLERPLTDHILANLRFWEKQGNPAAARWLRGYDFGQSSKVTGYRRPPGIS